MRPFALALLLSLAACAADRHGVSQNELPAPVMATLEANSRPGTVNSIIKETREKQVIYKADVTSNGKHWDVVINGDGSLMYKKER